MVFSVENFTGPMDLLLSIVEKQNENIYSVNICSIIDQYLEVIRKGEGGMESMSDFIVFAARLLEIKAYMLLPPGDEEEAEEDPAAELERHLADYRIFKELSGRLMGLYQSAGCTFVRPSSLRKILGSKESKQRMVEDALKDVTVFDLASLFQSVMEEKQKRGDPEGPKAIEMEKDDAPYSQVKEDVASFLHETKHCRFTDIPSCRKGKNSKIMSFLSILELSKEGEIQIEQDDEDIKIEKLPSHV